MMLLWSFKFKFFYARVFSTVLGELLGHVVILCFTFCGTVHLFYSSGAVSFPSAGSEGSNVSTPSPNTCYYRFGSGRPSGCEVASNCDLGWHHSNDECC